MFLGSLSTGDGFCGRWVHLTLMWQATSGSDKSSVRVNLTVFRVIAHSRHSGGLAMGSVQRRRQPAGNVDSLAVCLHLRGDDSLFQIRWATLILPDNWQALIETAFDPNGYAVYVVPNETNQCPSQSHHEQNMVGPNCCGGPKQTTKPWTLYCRRRSDTRTRLMRLRGE